MSQIIKLTQLENLKNLLETEESVFVKFGAEWCGPCKMVNASLEGIVANADNYDTTVPVIVSVDIDVAPELVSKFGVRAIPTCGMVGSNVNGTPVWMDTPLHGAQPRTALEKTMNLEEK